MVKSFELLHENIIVHYDVVGDLEDFDNSASHGNSKGTQVFSSNHAFRETKM